MSSHVCQCPNCQPQRFPPLGWQLDPGVVSVRMGWRGLDGIAMDGQRVQRCHTAFPGDHGFVIVYTDNGKQGKATAHKCRTCGDDACQEVLFGCVSTLKEGKV